MKTKSTAKKLNNKGFSLMELIVCIAVMAVLAASATASIAMLDSSYVKDAERGITDYLALTRSRAMTVAAKEWKLKVTLNAEGVYYAEMYKTVEETNAEGDVSIKAELVEQEELGNKLDIYYGEGNGTKVDGTKELSISFDPATGKIKQVFVGSDAQDISSGIGHIRIVRNEYVAKIKVYFNTGKCERE